MSDNEVNQCSLIIVECLKNNDQNNTLLLSDGKSQIIDEINETDETDEGWDPPQDSDHDFEYIIS